MKMLNQNRQNSAEDYVTKISEMVQSIACYQYIVEYNRNGSRYNHYSQKEHASSTQTDETEIRRRREREKIQECAATLIISRERNAEV